MAADRHIGIRKMPVFREWIDRLLRNLKHTRKNYSCSEVTSKFSLLEMQDSGQPPYLICKNALIRQQGDRFSPNLTCTRTKFFLFFVDLKKSFCWNYKMATYRHNGYLKMLLSGNESSDSHKI
jgi:hypothetical protein